MIEATSTLLRFYNDKHVLSLLTVMVRPPRYRRIQKELPEREVITEPARRSIYDVLQTNLKIAKRVNRDTQKSTSDGPLLGVLHPPTDVHRRAQLLGRRRGRSHGKELQTD